MSKNRRIRDTSVSPRDGGSTGRRREVIGVVGLGAAIFLLVALVSLQAGQLVMGPFGRAMASMFYGIAGICGYFLIAVAVVAAIRTLIEREPVMPASAVIGALVGVASLAILAHLVAGGYRVAGHGPGGALGEHLGEILRAVVSTAGTALLALVGLVVAAVVATPLRMRDVLRAVGGAAGAAAGAIAGAVLAVARFWGAVLRAMLPDRERDVDDDDDDGDALLEVDDRDVLEVGDDEAGAEPVIIGRQVKKKKRAAEPTELDAADAADGDLALARTSPAIEVIAAPASAGQAGASAGGEAAAAARPRRTRFASGTQAPALGDGALATLEPAPPLDPHDRPDDRPDDRPMIGPMVGPMVGPMIGRPAARLAAQPAALRAMPAPATARAR